jgi:hypothetical protein
MTATALQIKAYNTKLRMESILFDVFEKLSGAVDYSEKGAIIPEAIFMKLEKVITGAHTLTMGLLMALKGAGSYGTSRLIGNEETLRLRHLTIYYNLIRKAVATDGYGPNANDVAAYDLYGQITPLMTQWFSELRGRRIREASLLTIAEELTEDPVSLSHRFNSNIFIPNTDLGGMPVYDTRALTEGTGATYPANDTLTDASGDHVAAICAALHSATNGFANPEYTRITIESLLALDFHCSQNLKLDPMILDGKATLIFCIPSTQMIKLLNPTLSTNDNIGSIWKNVSALTKIENMIPGSYCRVRHLLLVEDDRYATITISGHAATPSYVITPGFMQPGNEDGRNNSTYSASNLVFDVGCVYGKGGMIEWVVNALKYATEAYDYELVKGKGAYQCAGIQLALYNVDEIAASDQHATTINRGTCIVLMARPSLVTTQ